jgi:hypothetical protein
MPVTALAEVTGSAALHLARLSHRREHRMACSHENFSRQFKQRSSSRHWAISGVRRVKRPAGGAGLMGAPGFVGDETTPLAWRKALSSGWRTGRRAAARVNPEARCATGHPPTTGDVQMPGRVTWRRLGSSAFGGQHRSSFEAEARQRRWKSAASR